MCISPVNGYGLKFSFTHFLNILGHFDSGKVRFSQMLPVWVKMAFSHIFPYWDPENTLCIITSWKIIQLTSNLHGSKITLRTNILESLVKRIYTCYVTWHHVTWFSDFRLKILWKLAEKVLTSAKYGQDRFSKLSFSEKSYPIQTKWGVNHFYMTNGSNTAVFSVGDL